MIVAGNGATGKNDEGLINENFELSKPKGVAWDDVNKVLYIADWRNHRVVKVATNGAVTTVLGTGTSGDGGANAGRNVEGGPAVDHVCGYPYDIVYDSANTSLYVACENSDVIKRLDTSTGNGYIIVGRLRTDGRIYLNGYNDGDIGAGTASSYAQTNSPRGLALDAGGNLYFIDAKCAVKVANMSGGVLSYFNGAKTAAAGKVTTLFGSSCGNRKEGAYTAVKLHYTYDIDILLDGADIKGFFASNYQNHVVMFVNNTTSTITYGGMDVPALEGQDVLGIYGNAYFDGDGQYGSVTKMRYPYGIHIDTDGNKLFFADRDNYRLRNLDLSINNGTVDTNLGRGYVMTGFISDSDAAPDEVILNRPHNITIDNVNSMLYYSDTRNCRVRQVNLVSGLVSTTIGNGCSDIHADDQDPLQIKMRAPTGLILHSGHLLYSDQYDPRVNGSKCLVRALNLSSASDLFGVSIAVGKVSTIAGNYSGVDDNNSWGGCPDPGNWNIPVDGALATQTTFPRRSPSGLATDGTNLYIALQYSHCIVKVAPDGTLTNHIGLCKSNGYQDDAILGQDPKEERLRYPSQIVIDPLNTATGNMFILDQIDQNPAKIRYANYSGAPVTIAGVTVLSGHIKTIMTTSSRYASGIAVNSEWVCYASGYVANYAWENYDYGYLGDNNVRCQNRTQGLFEIFGTIGVSGRPLTPTAHEGVDASTVTLNGPYGIVFDDAGNLYISEKGNGLIRKVAKWW